MTPKIKKSLAALMLIRYHKAFQYLITLGIIATTLFSVYLPHWAFEAMVLNAFTNLIWVWEPRNTL